MDEAVVYKWVQPEGESGRLLSHAAGIIPPELVMEYAQGSRTASPFGRLVAFSSLQAALDWQGQNDNDQLWSALAEDPQPYKYLINAGSVTAENARLFWFQSVGSRGLIFETAKGTIGCDALTLLERVR
jgi:hypothetical protein